MERARWSTAGRTLLGEWCDLPVESLAANARPGKLRLELWGDVLDPVYRRCVGRIARIPELRSRVDLVAVEERDAPGERNRRALLLEAFGHPYDGGPDLVVRLPDDRPCFAAKLAPLAFDDVSRFDALVLELDRLHESRELDRQATEFGAASGRTLSDLRPGLALLRREERRLLELPIGAAGQGMTPGLSTPAQLRLLVRRASRLGDTSSVGLAIRALEAIAQSTLVDHVSGGFFADAAAEDGAPAIRKRLTDAASYAQAFFEGFQLTREQRYRRLACESLDFALDHLRAPGGGYYAGRAPEDPHSRRFDFSQLTRLVGDDAPLVAHFYQLPSEPGVPGRLPTSRVPIAEVSARHRRPEPFVLDRLTNARLLLSDHVEEFPELVDERVLVEENSAFAEALLNGFRTVRDGRYRDAAEEVLEFLVERGSEQPGAGGWFREEPALALTPRASAHLASALSELVALGGAQNTRTEALRAAEPLAIVDLDRVEPGDLGILAQAARKLESTTNTTVLGIGAALGSAFSRPMARSLREDRATLLSELDAALAPALHAELRLAPGALGEQLAAAWGALYVAHRSDLWQPSEGESALVLRSGREAKRVVDPALVARTAVELQRRRPPRSFVDSRRVPGIATAEATRAYLNARGIADNRRVAIGELSVARVGLGTRALGLDSGEHREVVRAALLGGQNIVDVSPAFAFGDAERLVGDVLASPDVDRAAVVVVGRIGVFAGTDAARLAPLRKDTSVSPLASGVPLDSAFVALDPELLAASLEASLDRMGLECLDVGLLPWTEDQDPLERSKALEAGFERLDGARVAGRLGMLGIALPTGRDSALALEALSTLARRYGELVGPRPILAFPSTVDEGLSPSLSDAARAGRASIFALRPLTNVASGFVHRLVDREWDAGESSDARLRETRYRVASLDAEFETRFAPRLRSTSKLGPKPALELGGALGATLDKSESLEQFLLAEATFVTPHLTRVLADLSLLLAPFEDSEWTAFRENYVIRAAEFLAVLRARASDRSRDLAKAARRRHPSLEGRTLPEGALELLFDRGVSVAFVGEKTRSHVASWNEFLAGRR